jgi:hypothetical protein
MAFRLSSLAILVGDLAPQGVRSCLEGLPFSTSLQGWYSWTHEWHLRDRIYLARGLKQGGLLVARS